MKSGRLMWSKLAGIAAFQLAAYGLIARLLTGERPPWESIAILLVEILITSYLAIWVLINEHVKTRRQQQMMRNRREYLSAIENLMKENSR